MLFGIRLGGQLGRRAVLPGLLCLTLAACAAAEPRPALVAKSQTGSYGYSESRLSDDRYEIVYETPTLNVPVSGASRQERLDKEKQRAYDFALWHAAEVAKAQGYSALVVERERRDADVSVRAEPRYRPWPGFHPYYGYPYRYGYSPWGMYDYDPWDYDYHRWASARITVSLQVRFVKEPTEQSLSVDEILSRMASKYGRPTYK